MDEEKSVESRVKAVIAEQLGVKVNKVFSESSLEEDLGADSLDAIELVMKIEDEFGFGEIPDEDAEKLTTVKDIILYVTAKVEGA